MNTQELVPSLALATLVIVALIAVVMLVRFLSKRRNRDTMDDQPDRNVGKEIDEGARGPGTL